MASRSKDDAQRRWRAPRETDQFRADPCSGLDMSSVISDSGRSLASRRGDPGDVASGASSRSDRHTSVRTPLASSMSMDREVASSVISTREGADTKYRSAAPSGASPPTATTMRFSSARWRTARRGSRRGHKCGPSRSPRPHIRTLARGRFPLRAIDPKYSSQRPRSSCMRTIVGAEPRLSRLSSGCRNVQNWRSFLVHSGGPRT
jgi:hypothetical protein